MYILLFTEQGEETYPTLVIIAVIIVAVNVVVVIAGAIICWCQQRMCWCRYKPMKDNSDSKGTRNLFTTNSAVCGTGTFGQSNMEGYQPIPNPYGGKSSSNCRAFAADLWHGQMKIVIDFRDDPTTNPVQ